MTTNLEFEIADNAFDFILSAAENTKLGTPRGMKYGLLHLYAGIELLLKARLFAHDWKLIFENDDEVSEENLRNGSFRSVGIDLARQRLKEHLQIVIASGTKKRLERLRNLRNQVQHFQVAVDKSKVQALLAFGTNFVLDFTNEYLPTLQADKRDELRKIHEHHQSFNEFITARLDAIQDKLAAVGNIHDCPVCGQNTLDIGDEPDPECLFCNEKFDAQDMANEASESGHAEQCPDCHRDTAAILEGQSSQTWLCFGCGLEGEYRRCAGCGNPMIEKESPCTNCIDAYMEKDD